MTRKFFVDNNYFGLREEDVFFIEQPSVPCLTREGKYLLANKDELAVSPNGNGGVYETLLKSGAIDDMERRGIDTVMISGIDNGLLRVVDPEFMGLIAEEALDTALKVVPKACPEERVGVLCLLDKAPKIIEYTELPREMIFEMDPASGALRFNTGNICIHGFSFAFLKKCCQTIAHQMPYHLAFKAVPYWDPETQSHVVPRSPNAYKLERFVFDVIPFSQRTMAMQVERTEEFAPIKNATGAPTDSPDTARALINALHRGWLAAAGATISGSLSDVVEISPLLSYEGENLQAFATQTIQAPIYLAPPS